MSATKQGSVRLVSWKEIAAYLDCDVRTVMRWEKTRALPVRRLPGEGRSSVFALRSDLETWLLGNPDLRPTSQPEMSPAFDGPLKASATRRFRLAGAIAVSLLVAFVLLAAASRYVLAPNEQPSETSFTTDSLQAWDSHHRLLWEHRFPQPFANTAKVGDMRPSGNGVYGYDEVNRTTIQDLFGDGRSEVLSITLFNRSGSTNDDPRQVLSCFSSTGKLLWSYEPQDILTFGPRTYSAPWELIDLIVSDEPGRKTLWVSVEAYTWGKSFIARLDADGHATVQYVHSGQIGTFQRLHGPLGAMLWIGGFNDEYDTASLAVLRDTQTFAVSPQTPGSRYACTNCGQGDAFAYFVFPRYEMSRVLHNPNNRVYSITSDDAGIDVRQMELSNADQVLYDFSNDKNPRPVRVNYSSSFWPNHLELERQGKIKHPLAKCPDRLHPPPVRLYQDGRWSVLSVPSAYSEAQN